MAEIAEGAPRGRARGRSPGGHRARRRAGGARRRRRRRRQGPRALPGVRGRPHGALRRRGRRPRGPACATWSPEQVAQAAGGRLVAPGAHTGGPARAVIDSRAAGPGDLFVGLVGENVDGGRFAAQALAGGAWGVLVAPAHADAAARRRARSRDRGRRPARGPAAPGHRVAARAGLPRGRDHRVGGEDLDQGHPRGDAGPAPAHRGQPREPQHRDRAAHDRARGARRDRGARARDGDARSGPDRRADRHRRARRRPHHGRGAGPPRAHGLDRGDRGGQGRARRRPAPRRDGDRARRRDAARRPSPRRRHHGHLRAGRRCRRAPRRAWMVPGGGDGSAPTCAATRSPRWPRRAPWASSPTVCWTSRCRASAASGSSCPEGIVVVNDCYNANPMSMRAALDDLAASASGRRVAVLGDMLELGPDEDRFHAEIGAHARAAGVDVLVAVGPRAAHFADGYGEVIALPDAQAAAARGPGPAGARATPSCSRARAASASKSSPGRWKAPDGRGPHRRHGGAAHLHLPLAALHRRPCATASSASSSARRARRATTRRPAPRRWAGSSSSPPSRRRS